ncbi:DNA/RNA helicase domain-containing protein [Mycoplasma marinum]|uniref:Schlafen group 3-like DNA/RNA helicase domain-containing protein n=1 Tax=Mycoplasma marinum TaxID=1937190 RepID=A0A4R0XSD4_9MOLU|nr:DNA/RNA helicase domain-containing protein [Mycoplasma marinum]TCG10607.1 hypothetical protein C4B24_04410 [Mycoplasma marinum]
MIIYDAYVNDFLKSSKDPNVLVAEIRTNLWNKFGIKVAENEQRSWANSLPSVAKLINKSNKDFRKVLIEFNIPTSKKRIDFIILGKNKEGKPSAWLLELKQWSEVKEEEWNTFRVGRYTDSHPSDQATDYKFRLEHEMGMEGKIDIKSGAYLHNLNDENSPLLKGEYEDILNKSNLYYQQNEEELSRSIEHQTIIKESKEAFELFKTARWMPTKTFKESVQENFESIELVGSQKIIFNKIERFIKSWKQEDKMTFIISGDPGSGKTIIAFKLMNLFVAKLGMKMQMMLPGQEVRKAIKDEHYKAILSQNISGATMWKGYDSVIIDEAHKAIGRDTGIVNYSRNYKNIKFAIVLIDNDQVINRKGITKEEVKEIAIEAGHIVREFNIEESFRNSGERSLLDWIDHTFYNRKTISGDIEYEQSKYINKNQIYKLYSYENAKDFTDSYFAKREDNKSTRITSLWTSGYYVGPADENGRPKATLKIGEIGFPWNPNEEWAKAVKKNNIEDYETYNKNVKKYANDRKLFLTGNPHASYIAYFNHIQGYEFENIFVYIPNVFTYENKQIIFHRERLGKEVLTSQTWSPNSKAKSLRGRDTYELNKGYFLNRIKVMLTRGTKTTHVFAEDPDLNSYLNSKIEN